MLNSWKKRQTWMLCEKGGTLVAGPGTQHEQSEPHGTNLDSVGRGGRGLGGCERNNLPTVAETKLKCP